MVAPASYSPVAQFPRGCMPDFPSAPCFVHTPGTAEFWLKEEPLDQQRTNPYSLSAGWPQNVVVFDATGTLWRMIVPGASRYRTWFWRIASQVYNPIRLVRISWQTLRAYELSELVTVFRRQASRDDDSLTQFYEAEEIYRMLDDSRSFDDLLSVWHRLMNEPEGEGM